MKQKDYIDSFLNDLEKIQLQKFADNPEMMNVVKKVLLAGLYQNGTLKKGVKAEPGYNFALSLLRYTDSTGKEVSNEFVGEVLRACYEGLKSIEVAFSAFEEYKTPEEINKESNKAR